MEPEKLVEAQGLISELRRTAERVAATYLDREKGPKPQDLFYWKAADALQSLLSDHAGEGDPDTGKIGPGHVCKHGIRWPHPCQPCDNAALSRPSMSREDVARIIDPHAFKCWQASYDYCIKEGDSEAVARDIADRWHKPDMDAALAKADQILSLGARERVK